jgi:L-gulono-1,4-lactone dehydrogenase
MSSTASGTTSTRSGTWRSWAGNVTARPVREVTPASVEELSAAVRQAAEDGLKVKAVGTGHSFTAAAATDGVLIRPQLLTGIREIDREAGTVTVEAGTPLKRLNGALARGPVAHEHGRHHGADGVRRDQHRHPRHRP